jgi:PKD domain
VQVCRGGPSAPCSELEPAGHQTYRYAAVATDEWGQSAPVYSAPFVVPDSPPTARLTGPRRARSGARVSYTVRATDRDGDPLTYRWRLDGRTLARRSTKVFVRVQRRGVHRVSVTVSDGNGSTTRAATVLRVR